MKKWKKLKSQYVYKTEFGNLRADQCELPDGQIINNYYVNEYADWVNAIVLTKENKIILVKQYRYAAEDFFLEIPAGKPEGEEKYEQAIVREVREETGYITDKKPILIGEFYVNPATQTNKVVTFLLEDTYKAFGQELDTTEFIDVELVDINHMHSMITNGEINQLFTASAFYMFKAYLNERIGLKNL
ncbi:ADP-ribose pyrophosphatase [Bacillus sp. FJAT-22090]|uniref:NUDIX hydrolase n=1 Tax=Bacillus sp. FJAT-22090 TaxID=1581038 RepID=UPI0006AEC852|nr:NUDIX hydrolase [Bacillus sp. FJAT-22090]ALC85053.1 ADP-ribose pyrophosphatase [Bacillus sp. FJAT-22090]